MIVLFLTSFFSTRKFGSEAMCYAVFIQRGPRCDQVGAALAVKLRSLVSAMTGGVTTYSFGPAPVVSSTSLVGVNQESAFSIISSGDLITCASFDGLNLALTELQGLKDRCPNPLQPILVNEPNEGRLLQFIGSVLYLPADSADVNDLIETTTFISADMTAAKSALVSVQRIVSLLMKSTVEVCRLILCFSCVFRTSPFITAKTTSGCYQLEAFRNKRPLVASP